MANAVKCPFCGSFYDAHAYSVCPYCGNQAQENRPSQKRPPGLFDKIRSGIRGSVTSGTDSAAPARPSAYDPDRTIAPVHAPVPPKPAPPKAAAPKPEIPPQPRAAQPAHSLEEEVEHSRRTVGKYVSAKDGAAIAPVVGWIVGVQGDNYGRSFPLTSGVNRIGRSHQMDVKLMNDDSVARSCVAVIEYDRAANAFSMLPGESGSLCYLNGEAVCGREQLRGFDLLEFGNSELNKYLFVPLCGEQFRWKQAEAKTIDAEEPEASRR